MWSVNYNNREYPIENVFEIGSDWDNDLCLARLASQAVEIERNGGRNTN